MQIHDTRRALSPAFLSLYGSCALYPCMCACLPQRIHSPCPLTSFASTIPPCNFKFHNFVPSASCRALSIFLKPIQEQFSLSSQCCLSFFLSRLLVVVLLLLVNPCMLCFMHHHPSILITTAAAWTSAAAAARGPSRQPPQQQRKQATWRGTGGPLLPSVCFGG